jgi:CRISPR-associated endonuclease/helicase Cas3
MILSRESFPEFFAAANNDPAAGTPGAGPRPWRWQQRLLDRLLDTGRWPEAITAPTGAGKTSAIDIHVFATALMAAGVAGPVPRRLAMVVDRRVLVDDQYEHARTIADRLRRAERGILRQAADALRSLHPEALDGRGPNPLNVVRLRGGAPPDPSWRDDPTGCQILCATPDMIGSRLLFNGYGSTRQARPREAGLLAFDTALVIDEAHLARQLAVTARRVTELAMVADCPLPVAPLQVVRTTATPDQGESDSAGVEPADLEAGADEGLARRLATPKPVQLLGLDVWPLPKGGAARKNAINALAASAAELRAEFGPSVGCFMNNVATAMDLANKLSGDGFTVVLVCGRMRPWDVQRLRQDYPGVLDVRGNSAVDFVISTQSLEVGADLDFSALLTELAPPSAIAQRAGRVNRRGLRESTKVIVAVPIGGLADAQLLKAGFAAFLPYEPADIEAGLAWIRTLAGLTAGLAPQTLMGSPPPAQTLRRLLLQRPELSDAWIWAATSDRPFAEPALDLWLSDTLDADQDIGVIIRHGLPNDFGDARALIEATPPHGDETIPVRISLLPDCLLAMFSLSDAHSTGDADRPPALLVRDGEILDPGQSGAIRPGDELILDDSWPVFTVVGAAPLLVGVGGTDTGTDVFDQVAGGAVLRLGTGPTLTADHRDGPVAKALLRISDTGIGQQDNLAAQEAVADVLSELAAHLAADDADRSLAAAALLRRSLKASSVTLCQGADGQPLWFVVTDLRSVAPDEGLRQQWTASTTPVTLDRHRTNVAARALAIANVLRLGVMLGRTLEMAGYHHDDGKADPRFQKRMGADDPAVVLAKSGMVGKAQILRADAASGLPTGWRHEQLSVLECWPTLADMDGASWQLVARLVGTSHGYGRPHFPHTTARLGPGSGQAAELSRSLFDEGEWDMLIEQTHHHHGVWGCAFLEAVLRAADSQVSKEGS